MQIAQEDSIIKLINIYQIVLNQVLNDKQNVEIEKKRIEDSYIVCYNDARYLESKLQIKVDKLKMCKKSIVQKEKMLQTYQKIIDQYRKCIAL